MMQSTNNPAPQDSSGDLHNTAVKIAHSLLSQMYGPDGFTMRATTRNGVAVVMSDKPFFAGHSKDPAVAEDLQTIEKLLEVGEGKPEIGSEISLSIRGKDYPLIFSSMESLLKLAQLGIETVLRKYVLTDEDKKQVEVLRARMEALKRE